MINSSISGRSYRDVKWNVTEVIANQNDLTDSLAHTMNEINRHPKSFLFCATRVTTETIRRAREIHNLRRTQFLQSSEKSEEGIIPKYNKKLHYSQIFNTNWKYVIHINESKVFYRVPAYSKHWKHITYLRYYSQKVIAILETKLPVIP